jgi:hypothetical protein
MNAQIDEDMPGEIDFSNGTRGKFYKPNAVLRLPIYLDEKIESYLNEKASAKGVELSVLVNDLLKKEIEIIEAVR